MNGLFTYSTLIPMIWKYLRIWQGDTVKKPISLGVDLQASKIAIVGFPQTDDHLSGIKAGSPSGRKSPIHHTKCGI